MARKSKPISFERWTRNAKSLAKKLHASGDPLAVSIDGKSTVLVMSKDAHERMFNAAEERAVIAAVRRGRREVAAGGGRPWEQVREELLSLSRKKRRKSA